jgi:RND family efflux transporter MFP subunit
MRKTILLLAVCLAGCGESKNPKAASSTSVSVARVPVVAVATQPFEATITFTGTLISRSQVDVKAETTGRVLRFTKQEGESVRAGEELVWVNDENYKLDIRQARSAVMVAEASLERAKVLASHASSELERAGHLMASGGITDKDLKSARVTEQDGKAQVALAQAQLDQARAAVAVAEKRQRDTVIRAPVNGEIQKRYVNPGAYVEPPTPVFTLVDNQKLEIETPVPTAEMGPLRAGQRVKFSVNAFPGSTFEGRVVEILPAVEAQTRSARVRVSVNNAGGKLKAGMFVQGEILTGVTAQAVVIPASAVYRDDRSTKATFVYVVKDNKAARQDVRIGREHGSELEVTEGLSPGALLIAEQSIEIADGIRVEARR